MQKIKNTSELKTLSLDLIPNPRNKYIYDMISEDFSIYGLNVFNSRYSKIRLLLNKNSIDTHTLLGAVKNKSSYSEEALTRNKLEQKYISSILLSSLKSNKIQLRSYPEKESVISSIHMYGEDRELYLENFINLTKNALGITRSSIEKRFKCRYDYKVPTEEKDDFEDDWNDGCDKIHSQITEELKNLAEDKSNKFIYEHILSNILPEKELNNDLNENNAKKFFETVVWNKLYNFQKDGVKALIKKIDIYDGAILADSVGLGKTFEALAVIKYYELQGLRVLVLCPKKLRDNWEIYKGNKKRNVLNDDNLQYEILNHTDISREHFIKKYNLDNYDLVVIDESHNFRNSQKKNKRFNKILSDIFQKGRKTRVLMLSATPVNNGMKDLGSQIKFITNDDDEHFSQYGLSSISYILKIAQRRFNEWLKSTKEGDHTTQSLLNTLNTDYTILLDMLTIARSRRHIEEYYDLKDIGVFPKRLPLITQKSNIDMNNKFPDIKIVNDIIESLDLPTYKLLSYISLGKQQVYTEKYDQKDEDGNVIFTQKQREENLIHLKRVNLFKRLESSIHSFTLSLKKLEDGLKGALETIKNYTPTATAQNISILDEEIDENILFGDKIKVLLADMDLNRWKQHIEQDLIKVSSLLAECNNVLDNRDAKLVDLKELIQKKIENPINTTNKKVLIFTAFADTAQYLYDNISTWALNTYGLHTAYVEGGNKVKTTLQGLSNSLQEILLNFSPISQERDKVEDTIVGDIDILIATDCIAEGQNLQDCDYIINYDIHWNPVRIIQRFGRIDRLGSTNTNIQLVNFLPNKDVDEYLSLVDKVMGKMALLDASSTADDNIITPEVVKNDTYYRNKQIRNMVESQEYPNLDAEVGNISIAGMTMEDFRLDVADCPIQDIKQSAKGVYSVVSSNMVNALPAGVIFCLENKADTVIQDKQALEPYYLVYMKQDGTVLHPHTSTHTILSTLKKNLKPHGTIDKKALEVFNKNTDGGKNMSLYQSLLEKAEGSIFNKTQETSKKSILSKGVSTLSKTNINLTADMHVISFVIVVNT